MANMSYCRFNNTLKDLEDCAQHIPDHMRPSRDYDSEFVKRRKLIELCIHIASEYGMRDADGTLTGDVQPEEDWEESEG